MRAGGRLTGHVDVEILKIDADSGDCGRFGSVSEREKSEERVKWLIRHQR